MGTPVTPFVACDVFVINELNQVLLIQRSDNGFWALPGGYHDLRKTPQEYAERECLEETGLAIQCEYLIGVYSSNRYEYVHYPWKDNEYCHLFFKANVLGGQEKISEETINIGWFDEDNFPKLSDGQLTRIEHGFESVRSEKWKVYFE